VNKLISILMLALSLCSMPAQSEQAVSSDDPELTGEPSIPLEYDDRIYERKSRNTGENEKTVHCRHLKQKVDELKGKPQRRHVALQRYKLECEDRSDSYDQRHTYGDPNF